MTSVKADDILAAIHDHITHELLEQKGLVLDKDAPLVDGGYLTSLQAVELVMFLEEHFHIEIPAEEVDEKSFSTLKSIAALVESKLS